MKNKIAMIGVVMLSAGLLTGCGTDCETPEISSRLATVSKYASTGEEYKIHFKEGFTGKVEDFDEVSDSEDRIRCSATVSVTGTAKAHMQKLSSELGGAWGMEAISRLADGNEAVKAVREALNDLQLLRGDHASELLTLRMPLQYTVSKEDNSLIEVLMDGESYQASMVKAFTDLREQVKKPLEAQLAEEKKKRDADARKLGYKDEEHRVSVAQRISDGHLKMPALEANIVRLNKGVPQMEARRTEMTASLEKYRANIGALSAAATEFSETIKGVRLKPNPYITIDDLSLRAVDMWGKTMVNLKGSMKNISGKPLYGFKFDVVAWGDESGIVHGTHFGLIGGTTRVGGTTTFAVNINDGFYGREVLATPAFTNSTKRGVYLVLTELQVDGKEVQTGATDPVTAFKKAQAAIDSLPGEIATLEQEIADAKQEIAKTYAELEKVKTDFNTAQDEQKAADTKRRG